MARINVEDDIELRIEYRRLLKLVGGDDDKAMGMLVRFWRVAQRYWGQNQLVPIEEFNEWGFQPLIESRWAIVKPEGVEAYGAASQFSWYRQRCESGKIGGHARATGLRDESGKFVSTPHEVQPKPTRTPHDIHTVTTPLAPALAPALKKEKEEAPMDLKLEIQKCTKAWIDTLKHHGIDRKLMPHEETKIGSVVQQRGSDVVLLAFLGMKHEPAGEDYKPSRYVTLARVLDPQKFDYFVNLGAQAEKQIREKDKLREQLRITRDSYAVDGDEPSHADPERVRSIIAGVFRGEK